MVKEEPNSIQKWQEFLDWLEDNRDNMPDWADESMTVHECRLLWLDKVKNDNQQDNMLSQGT